MAHKLIEAIPVSNRIIAGGAIASAIMGIVALLTMIGVDWPLTEKSPIIQQSIEFDQIQELEVARINAEIKRAEYARLEGSIESDEFLMGQYDKPDLTEGERIQKNRLLRRIARHRREQDRLDKK